MRPSFPLTFRRFLNRGDLDGFGRAVKTVADDCAGACIALDELRKDLGLRDEGNVRH